MKSVPTPRLRAPFPALYQRHRASVYATALRVLGRPADAEDVTQEVFVRYWRQPERFNPERGELGPYLRLMARSRALDLLRHEQADGRAQDRLKAVSPRENGRSESAHAGILSRRNFKTAYAAPGKTERSAVWPATCCGPSPSTPTWPTTCIWRIGFTPSFSKASRDLCRSGAQRPERRIDSTR